MSGFLTNLASLALGAPLPGSARLTLPSRFGGRIAAGGLEVVEQAERAAAPATDAAVAPASAVIRFALREDNLRAPYPASVRPAPTTDELPTKRAPTEKVETVPSTVERDVVETSRVQPPIPAQQSAAPARRQAEPQSSTTSHAARQIAPARGILASDRFQPSRPVPLSEAVVASRAAVEREQRPVVNVTIDRIEVRAPRQAPSPPVQPRKKPQPSVSLADYLGARS